MSIFSDCDTLDLSSVEMSSVYVNPYKDECKTEYLTDNDLSTYGCTQFEDEPTLTFNLPAKATISYVIINNRITTDRYYQFKDGDRLNNAKITTKLGSETVKMCGTVRTTTDYSVEGQTYPINCAGTLADKVVISTNYRTLRDRNPLLNIAEVSICGKVRGKLTFKR